MNQLLWIVLGLGSFVPSGNIPQTNLTDLEIQTRVDQLQKELDELKALLRQRTSRPATAPAATPNPITSSPPGKFRFGGFIQLRALDDQITTNAPKRAAGGDQFNPRRGRLEFTGDLSRYLLGRLTFDIGATALAARDAYIDVHTQPVLFRLGQFKIPFDYEITQSATDLMALERTLLNQRLFPGNRDRGVMADINLIKSIGQPLSIQFAILNGTGQNQNDNDEGKDVFGSVFYNTRYFQVRLAAISGRFTFAPTIGPPIRTSKRRVGISLRGVWRDWDLHGQFTRGHGESPMGGGAPLLTGTQGTTSSFNNNDVEGWYVMAARRLHALPVTLWAKFESFDPNINAGLDRISIGGIGSIWDATPQLRLTLGLYRKAFRTSPQKTTLGFQTQLKF